MFYVDPWSDTVVHVLHLEYKLGLCVIGYLKMWTPGERTSRSLSEWTPLGDYKDQKGVETQEDPGGETGVDC